MAQGKLKKATGKVNPSIGSLMDDAVLPVIANQSFASVDRPERVYNQGLVNTTNSGMRYRFPHLYNGLMPFQAQGGYISIKDAVWLCQKAYFNVALFRNAINTLAELCNTEVYLEGGNQQSRDFFTAWFKRINLWKLKDMFFREIFRSGNVFLFRVEGDIAKTDALKLSQTYGATDNLQLPLRYIMLNVSDIAALNNITYDSPVYYKILTPQQIKILKKSTNNDDKELYKNLPAALKDYFDGAQTAKPIPLDLSKLHTIFYQKQDYEPFAVPMGFAVLDDLNLKLEFKKTDAVLARTVEFVTLLVTTGEKIQDGVGGVNPKTIAALQTVFSKEQIGRVLVADYTTKMDWSIPDLTKVLGASKYEAVNQDISSGLMDIFFGQEKFANVAMKLKVFVEKLSRVQEIFLNDFLQAEIRRISQLMNFKSYPTAKFITTSLDDPTQAMRIYAQLSQLGVLTPKDTINAIETGELPEFEELVENHKEYKTLKDEGLFQPVSGGVEDQLKVLDETGKQQAEMTKIQQDHEAKMTKQQQKHEAANPPPPAPPAIHINTPSAPKNPSGRPPGAKSPQSSKKVSPIGTASTTEGKISLAKLIDNVQLLEKVRNEFSLAYKKRKNLSKLTKSHKDAIDQMMKTLLENEASDQWVAKISDYVENPVPPNLDRVLEIEEIANEYEISNEGAILVYNSKI